MDATDVVISICLFIAFAGIVWLVYMIFQEDQVNTLCQTYGWDSGNISAGISYCTNQVVCLLDNVIANSCK